MNNEEVKKSKKKFFKKWWFWVILILVLSRLGSGNKTKDENTVAGNNESITKPSAIIPADENTFIQIIQSAQSKSGNAANDMQRGGIKAEREKEICKIIKGSVKNWIGQIVKIDANSEGKGVLEIEIAEKIKIKTSNNAFSDTNYSTLLSPDSIIFKTASAMKVGQSVKFSGDFFRGEEEGECLAEGSLTLDGKLSDPEYIFKFSKLD